MWHHQAAAFWNFPLQCSNMGLGCTAAWSVMSAYARIRKLPLWLVPQTSESSCCDFATGQVPYPAFLSKHWFQESNAYALRGHVRHIILKQFREQNKLPEDHPSVLNMISDIEDFPKSDIPK